jgi:hypothetical protein
MASTATWLIICGFVLLVSGVVLRTVIMMRSSDASDPSARTLHGRELILQYRRLHPRSVALLATRWLLISGVILLLAGLASEFSR